MQAAIRPSQNNTPGSGATPLPGAQLHPLCRGYMSSACRFAPGLLLLVGCISAIGPSSPPPGSGLPYTIATTLHVVAAACGSVYALLASAGGDAPGVGKGAGTGGGGATNGGRPRQCLGCHPNTDHGGGRDWAGSAFAQYSGHCQGFFPSCQTPVSTPR